MLAWQQAIPTKPKEAFSVEQLLPSRSVSPSTLCYVAARICGSMDVELEGYRSILSKWYIFLLFLVSCCIPIYV